MSFFSSHWCQRQFVYSRDICGQVEWTGGRWNDFHQSHWSPLADHDWPDASLLLLHTTHTHTLLVHPASGPVFYTGIPHTHSPPLFHTGLSNSRLLTSHLLHTGLTPGHSSFLAWTFLCQHYLWQTKLAKLSDKTLQSSTVWWCIGNLSLSKLFFHPWPVLE